MNVDSLVLWGFVATVTLTLLTVGAQSLGLTRIDIPFILGTMFTPDRDRAKGVGVVLHLLNGWAIALLYGLIFRDVLASWWTGALLGIVQGLFVVVVVLPIVPGFHPRMVSEFRGPEPTRLLEPPGFLARNYGRNTPWIIVAAHAVYGAIIGTFYMLG